MVNWTNVSGFVFALLLAGANASASDAAPIPVTVAPLSRMLTHPQRSAPATAVSLNDARLSARINARILAIPVRVGDRVHQGQTLARLDCRDAKLVLRSAEARQRLARKALTRARSLKKTRSIAASQINQAEAEQTQAEVAVQQAKLQVERCQIRAPFDGIVTARLASEGMLATPGTPVLQLIDESRLEIRATVPVTEITSLQQATAIRFHSGTQRFPVRLRSLLPTLNPAANTREARFEPETSPPLVGASGRIEWRLTTPHLPARLLVERNGSLGIFTVANRIAHFQPLPHARLGEDVAVELPGSTRLVIDGRFALHDGDRIEITNGDAS